MEKTKTANMMQTAFHALDEKKAVNISIIDISEISILADYFVIASGNNPNQIHAMADHLEEKMKASGFQPVGTEGYRNANWILMDYGDVIIHLFDKESRSFYNLERIWSDGKKIEPETI